MARCVRALHYQKTFARGKTDSMARWAADSITVKAEIDPVQTASALDVGYGVEFIKQLFLVILRFGAAETEVC